MTLSFLGRIPRWTIFFGVLWALNALIIINL